MHDREYTVNKLPSPCERGLPLFLAAANILSAQWHPACLGATTCEGHVHKHIFKEAPSQAHHVKTLRMAYRLGVSEVVW